MRRIKQFLSLLLKVYLFLCVAFVALAILWTGIGLCCGSQLAEWIHLGADRHICSNIPEDTEVHLQDPLPEITIESPIITPITIQNATHIDAITDIEALELFKLWLLGDHILPHPSGEYRIYVKTNPSAATEIYICDTEGNPLRTFLKDETAEVLFSPDYTMLAIYEARFGRIELFDAESLEDLSTINVREGTTYTLIRSIAFHPTEPILAFTRSIIGNDTFELYLWNIDSNRLIDIIEVAEIYQSSLTFNAGGTVLYFADEEGGHVWGIPMEE